ncbi:MAG TPA: glycosyltransferase family 4 protein [Opitutaceae bacterium]
MSEAIPPEVVSSATSTAGGEPAAPLRACFVPFFHQNPYQRELARNLAACGVQVSAQPGLKGVIRDVVLRRGAPRLIHLHWLPRVSRTPRGLFQLALFVVRLYTLRFLGRRIVWTAHNLYPHDVGGYFLERWLTRRVIAWSTCIIAHSPSAAELVGAEFGPRARRKLNVIPHGNYIGAYPNTLSRADARARLGLPPQATVFLFLGNIRPYKGVNELIRAFRQLRAPESVLVVAGKPFHESAVAELQEATGGDPRILLRPGYVPDADIQVYMNAADAVVFPYQDILTSGAVVLAMSFGRACIAPTIGCIPDMLDGRGAFLYSPAAPAALEAALQRACDQRDTLDTMGAHNIKTAAQWGWDVIAAQTARVYRQAFSTAHRIEIPATHSHEKVLAQASGRPAAPERFPDQPN